MRLTLPETADALGLSEDSVDAVHDEAVRLRAEVESLRERLDLTQQSDRAMARRAERAEQERDEARAEVERLRALALVPMDGPPTEPGWYVMLDKDDRRHVVQVYGPPGTTLCVDHGGWGWHTVDAAPTGLLWLARIPGEALEVSDGE